MTANPDVIARFAASGLLGDDPVIASRLKMVEREYEFAIQCPAHVRFSELRDEGWKDGAGNPTNACSDVGFLLAHVGGIHIRLTDVSAWLGEVKSLIASGKPAELERAREILERLGIECKPRRGLPSPNNRNT